VLLCGGCYTTVISSGQASHKTAVAYDERWHSGFIGGTLEHHGDYNLDQACSPGWSSVETETSFLNGLVENLPASSTTRRRSA
jgi:hypothetical protein